MLRVRELRALAETARNMARSATSEAERDALEKMAADYVLKADERERLLRLSGRDPEDRHRSHRSDADWDGTAASAVRIMRSRPIPGPASPNR